MTPTSIEQSKKLLELGLDPNTADLSHHEDDGLEFIPYRLIALNERSEYLPRWSADGLLEMLRNTSDCNRLEVFTNRASKWEVTISYYDHVLKEHTVSTMSLIESVYEMVCWMIENGYIKIEKE